VKGPIPGQDTGVEVKRLDLKFRARKERVVGQISGDRGNRRIPKAGHGYMRREFPTFRLKAQLDKDRLHPVAQGGNGFNGLSARPQDVRLLAGREKAESGKQHGKSGTLYIGKPLPYILKNSIVHLADKAQGEMDLLIRYPACTGQSGIDPGQFPLYSLREINGYKKSMHGHTSR